MRVRNMKRKTDERVPREGISTNSGDSHKEKSINSPKITTPSHALGGSFVWFVSDNSLPLPAGKNGREGDCCHWLAA